MKLKKIGATLLTGIFTFAMASGAFAQSNEPLEKDVDIKLEIKRVVDVDNLTVKVNEEVDLEVTTQKKGSSYEVTDWSVSLIDRDGNELGTADKNDYEFTDNGYDLLPLPVLEGSDERADFYVHHFKFSASQAGIYEIKAIVAMKAGKSHVSWIGESNSVVQEVVADIPNATAVVVKDFRSTFSKGTTTASYKLYIVFDNGTEEYFETITDQQWNGQGNQTFLIEYKTKTFEYTVKHQ